MTSLWLDRKIAEIRASTPERNTVIVRRWTCIDCRTPRSAIRKGLRCTACSELHGRERRKLRSAKRPAHVEPVEQSRRKGAWYEVDPDIAAYRAEKAKRDARAASDTVSIESATAEARAILHAESGDPIRKRKAS